MVGWLPRLKHGMIDSRDLGVDLNLERNWRENWRLQIHNTDRYRHPGRQVPAAERA